MDRKFYLLRILVALFVLSSCKAPQISYFQDSHDGDYYTLSDKGTIKLRPGDKLVILVNTKVQEYNNIYNLPYSPIRIGQSSNVKTATPQGVACYTIDGKGNIDFPLLGTIEAAGMTREQLAVHIKQEMLDKNLANDDPLIVTVDYANLNISVLGEVKNPGRYSVEKDKITILEALGMAGDLTIYGERDDVVVLREEAGKQNTYVVDLTSTMKLVKSPVYYLQQNDIVYVKPNTMRQRQATVSGNTVYTPTFWISVASLLTTISAIIINNN